MPDPTRPKDDPAHEQTIESIADAYWSNQLAGKPTLIAAIRKAYWLGHLRGNIYGDERSASRPKRCADCGTNYADYPSPYCCGCEAHREHTNVY